MSPVVRRKCSKIFVVSILASISFFALMFFTSCSSDAHKTVNNKTDLSVEVSEEDRIWMDKFFRDLLLDDTNCAMTYTLFGTKPMSSIILTVATLPEIMEGSKKMISPHIESLSPEKKEEIFQRLETYWKEYDLSDNWDRWIEWKKDRHNSRFLFRKEPTSNPHLFSAYMINTEEVLWVFHKHYTTFKESLGFDFDPLEKALEFESLDSVFWEKVLSNDFLIGLLYGFGERNAYFFSAIRKKKDEKIKSIFPSGFSSKSSEDPLFHDSTLEKLSIPPFVSYELPYGEDPIVINFKKEREIIQNSLKGKDWLDEVLKKIIGR